MPSVTKSNFCSPRSAVASFLLLCHVRLHVCYCFDRVPGFVAVGIASTAGIALAAGTASSSPSAFGQTAAASAQKYAVISGWCWLSIAVGLECLCVPG